MISERLLESSPRLSLTLVFVLWKALLFAIAVCNPGPGYDTSTTLLAQGNSPWTRPFVRWDAIYFTEVARRDYVFEQEWAFSWGLTRVMGAGAKYMKATPWLSVASPEAWIGIAIAHVSHLIAVQALYSLTCELFGKRAHARCLAQTAALLHVFSPAGLFLSAPYAESPFAALQFIGYWAWVSSWAPSKRSTWLRGVRVLLSGLCFGLAMPLRSNGLLSGILFAYDAAHLSAQFLGGHRTRAVMVRLALAVLAGSCIAIGAAVPQYFAYQKYCSTAPGQTELRPWCSRRVPSIYTFVQAHYWDNGFLRYWTLSNIPLFLLAAPTMWVLARSSYWAFAESPDVFHRTGEDLQPTDDQTRDAVHILRIIAIPQTVLMLATLLNSHVQIITRIASGYPVWYIWMACLIAGLSPKHSSKTSTYLVRWMVLYAAIQGGLYASFLPPA